MTSTDGGHDSETEVFLVREWRPCLLHWLQRRSSCLVIEMSRTVTVWEGEFLVYYWLFSNSFMSGWSQVVCRLTLRPREEKGRKDLFCCLVLHAPLFIVYPSCEAEFKSHLSLQDCHGDKYLKLEPTQKITYLFESPCFHSTAVPSELPVGGNWLCVCS